MYIATTESQPLVIFRKRVGNAVNINCTDTQNKSYTQCIRTKSIHKFETNQSCIPNDYINIERTDIKKDFAKDTHQT